MADAMGLVKEFSAKVTPDVFPKLLKIMTPPQTAAAMQIYSASKKGDAAMVEASAKAFIITVTSEQRVKLVDILGEGLVGKLEAFK
jgi:hypothetical protein